jgi:hypothetical protein
MESIVDIVFNAENIRMLVLLVFGFCGYVLIKSQMKGLEYSLLKAMDEKIATANQSLYAQLKANDFKHLNDTIEALTFILEKNKFLTIEDKEYIDGRLDK